MHSYQFEVKEYNPDFFSDTLRFTVNLHYPELVTQDFVENQCSWLINIALHDAAHDHYQHKIPGLFGTVTTTSNGVSYHDDPSILTSKNLIAWADVFRSPDTVRKIILRHPLWNDSISRQKRKPQVLEIIDFKITRKSCIACGYLLRRTEKFCSDCGQNLMVNAQKPISSLSLTEIPDKLRSRHVYIPGSSQHGKSTFIENMALKDIARGHGVAILDPKGDLIKSIIHKIPSHQAAKVILLEAKNPVPIDIMGWQTEQEKETLASDIFDTFLAFSTMTAGDQWQSILQATIATLLDAKHCSFLDINAILVDEDKRKTILGRVKNQNILDYWRLEFPHLKKDATQPIITRMKKFTFSAALTKLLGCVDAPLDLFEVMEKQKILLVDLTGVGKGNGRQIGQLIVSKIQQAVLRREDQQREQRIPFYLYCDEFQNFQTSAFDTILSEAGGYKLCLTLANQGLYQLTNSAVKDAIFSNVTGAWIIFHLDERDVNNFKLKALPLDSRELAALPPYQAFIKLGTETPSILPTPPPTRIPPDSYADDIRTRTLENYSCKTEPKPHTSGDGNTKAPEEKPQDDTRKAGGVGDSGQQFRSTQQGHRATYPKKSSYQKRHPDSLREPSPTEPLDE